MSTQVCASGPDLMPMNSDEEEIDIKPSIVRVSYNQDGGLFEKVQKP